MRLSRLDRFGAIEFLLVFLFFFHLFSQFFSQKRYFRYITNSISRCNSTSSIQPWQKISKKKILRKFWITRTLYLLQIWNTHWEVHKLMDMLHNSNFNSIHMRNGDPFCHFPSIHVRRCQLSNFNGNEKVLFEEYS